MLSVIVVVFIVGYLAIALEHFLHVNKAASALLTGVLCWTLYAIDHSALVPDGAFQAWQIIHSAEVEHEGKLEFVNWQLGHAFVEAAGILFFLMGAMTIVELIDAHEGFSVITKRIRAKSPSALLWLIAWIAFFLSAVLDNLTTTIVMISVLRKLVSETQMRLKFAGLIVIAANAGGAWTVIGDVTTTMIWMKGRIGEWEVMRELFFPSCVCLLIPLMILSRGLREEKLESLTEDDSNDDKSIAPWHRVLFLVLGLAALLGVPVFKTLTHLPPFMGMMLSLGMLWIVSEFVGHTMDEKTKSSTGVLPALRRIDMPSVLFFFGILLAVGALSAMGILQHLAEMLQRTLQNQTLIAFVIGLVSSVVDNVPLVAAGLEMYHATPPNDSFWMLLAYCGGTGGSCLIIGSAAGVAAMGLEKIDFFWYLKQIAPLALAGYVAGVLFYLVQYAIFQH